MSVRSLKCPGCQSTVNVPVAIQQARCPSCGMIFSASGEQPIANRKDDELLRSAGGREVSSSDSDESGQVVVYASVAVAIVCLFLFGFAGIYFMPKGAPDVPEAEPQALQPVLREPTEAELAALVIVDLPEEQRRRIYIDTRATAKTSTEKPLMVPGGKVRQKLEGMLESTYENSLRQLAALHDVSVEEVKLIVAEGDLKNWDPSARSRAYRDGERIYEDERTQGYKGK